jgi:predicted transcriptional regulator
LIIKVVLSTAPLERVTIFDLLLAKGGTLNVNQITNFLNVSEPTSRRTMTELMVLELVDMTTQALVCSDGQSRNGLVITQRSIPLVFVR